MKKMAHGASRNIHTAEQTHDTPPGSGVRALMVAVLEDGIHNLSSSKRLVRATAEQWMMSREHRYVFSFVVICETLDLVPKAVRRSVMGLLDKYEKHTHGRLLRRSRPNIRRGGVIQLPSADRGDGVRAHALRARVA